MKLLFLYIENFRVHQPRSFSFDSCHCFDYDPGTRMLMCHRAAEGALADDFFAVREKAKSRVDSVSAIIGENGSGKTTLALSMASLLSRCGIKTLLVDCDLSTNGATYFYEDKFCYPVPSRS